MIRLLILIALAYAYISYSATPQFIASEQPKLCAAIRGNGHLLFAHFTSLARIVENYGVIDGLAGGSSASLSLFLYESILDNPAVWNCGDHRCSDKEAALRISFLLKGITPAIGQMLPSEAKLFLASSGKEDNLSELKRWLRDGMPHFRLRLIRLIADRKAQAIFTEKLSELENTPGSEFLNANIKRKLWAYLHRMPEAERHELLKAIETMSFKFDGKDIGILLRDGIVDFPTIVKKMGVVADFLAGRDTSLDSRMLSLFGHCATSHAGRVWEDFSSDANLKNCQAEYQRIFHEYLINRKSAKALPSRLDDFVGERANILVANAVLVGKSVDDFQRAQKSYEAQLRANQDPQTSFKIDFAKDIRSGYWGRRSSIDRIGKSLQGTEDLKSQKFYPMGSTTWRWALAHSIAEPGLAKAQVQAANQDIPEPTVSLAGWLDPHPVPVLKSLGCENVVLITREFPVDNEFATALSQLFNISPADQEALFSADNPSSSYNYSLRSADAIWCAKWNYFQKPEEIPKLLRDAYMAPIVTTSSFFLNAPNVLPQGVVKQGCTPKEK